MIIFQNSCTPREGRITITTRAGLDNMRFDCQGACVSVKWIPTHNVPRLWLVRVGSCENNALLNALTKKKIYTPFSISSLGEKRKCWVVDIALRLCLLVLVGSIRAGYQSTFILDLIKGYQPGYWDHAETSKQ